MEKLEKEMLLNNYVNPSNKYRKEMREWENIMNLTEKATMKTIYRKCRWRKQRKTNWYKCCQRENKELNQKKCKPDK